MAPRGGADSRARACRTVFKGDRAPLETSFTGHLETRTPDHSQGPPISLSFLRPHKGKPRVLTRDCQKPHTSDEGAEKLPFYLDDIPGHTEAGSCHLSCFKHPWGTFASQSLPRREILSIWGGGITPSGMWNFCSQGSKPCPLQWKRRVSTTGSPGSPPWSVLFYLNIYSLTWLHQVSSAACGIFDCGIQTPSCRPWDLFS